MSEANSADEVPSVHSIGVRSWALRATTSLPCYTSYPPLGSFAPSLT
jgi:hypothetical protein